MSGRRARSHPMQPLVREPGSDVVRFKANNIVRFLLDRGPYSLSQLRGMQFSKSDWSQLCQLIGYSVRGYCELDFIPEGDKNEVCRREEALKNGPDNQDVASVHGAEKSS